MHGYGDITQEQLIKDTMLRRSGISKSSKDDHMSGEKRRRTGGVVTGGAKRGLAMRRVYYPMHLSSKKAINFVANTNKTNDLTYSLQNAPMHIPTHAVDIYVACVSFTHQEINLTGYYQVEVSFANGGLGVDGNINHAVYAKHAISNSEHRIHHARGTEPDYPNYKVPCAQQLIGDGITQFTVRIVDENRNLKSGFDSNYCLTLVVEWQEQIDTDRLLASGTETEHR